MGDMDDLRVGVKPLSVWHVVGAIAIAAGFVITLDRSEVSWSDGHVHATYRNWGALAGGAVAIACGALALVMLSRVARAQRALSALASIAILGGGGYQVARGLGVFFDPGAPPGGSSHEIGGDRVEPPPVTPRSAPPPDAGPSPAELAGADEKSKYDLCGDAGPACVAWRAAAERACTLGVQSSCADLAADLVVDGKGGPLDPARGRALAQHACDAASSYGCVVLSYAEEKGVGGAVDLPKALLAADAACAADSNQGCKNLQAILDEDAAASDAEKMGGYDVVCRHLNSLESCTAGAKLYAAIAAPTPDQQHELRGLLASACRLDGDGACARYASILRHANKDALADAVAEHGCHLGGRAMCQKGQSPHPGPVVMTMATAWFDPDEYDQVAVIDAVEESLRLCAKAALGGAGRPTVHVTIDEKGSLEWKSTDWAGRPAELQQCIAQHLPATANPVGIAPGDTVEFSIVLGFGTQH